MSFNELKLVFRCLKYTKSSYQGVILTPWSYSSIFSPWYRYSDINWQFLCDIWSLPERRSPLKQEKKAGNPHIFLIWSSPWFIIGLTTSNHYANFIWCLGFAAHFHVRPSKSVCMLSVCMLSVCMLSVCMLSYLVMISYRNHHAPFYPHK